MSPSRKNQKNNRIINSLLAIGIILLLVLLVYQIPWVHQRIAWRLEVAYNYIRLVFHPIGTPPLSLESIKLTTATNISPTATITPMSSSSAPISTPTLTTIPNLTSFPTLVTLTPPVFNQSRDTQDWNNCGPATLALYLRFFGWQGDQYTISDIVKPNRGDKNVNIDELQNFVSTQAGWLGAEFRVGGSVDLLKQFIASGLPIMIEESFIFGGDDYWPNDDHWTGHYLLLTGFDDTNKVFISQDAYTGPNTLKSYRDLDSAWKAFNRVFMVVFPAQRLDAIKGLLGADWDKDANRQHALDAARLETSVNPEDPFPWFNLGSNYAYFEKYPEAALAYDEAIKIGIPQRMLRYQFGPFIANFKINRNNDLLSLTKFALNITPNSEEVLLWQGWALYRSGDREGAIKAIKDALIAHPGYSDAVYALDFINTHP